MCLRFSTIALVLILVLICGVDGKEMPNSAEDSVRAVDTPGEAIISAMKYLGLNNNKEINIDSLQVFCSLIIARDSTTAILSNRIDNHKAWSVTFYNIELEDPYVAPKYRYRGNKNITIWLDAETGLLLKVTGEILNFKEDEIIEPLSSLADDKLSNRERYIGFPDVYPKYDLHNVLNNSRGAKGNGILAKKFTALYIYYNSLESKLEDIRAWCITFYGLPGVPIAMPPYNTSMRVIINADNGEGLLRVVPY
jgi:hypothetical protein